MVAEVHEAVSDEEVMETLPVMLELRSHLDETEYPAIVRRMREAGYRLAFVFDAGYVRAVAGFRELESLAHGRFMYVDELVTDESARSQGYGRLLFRWLTDEAQKAGCERLQLDSGVQRTEAHRFYFREGMGISSFHFSKVLNE